MQINAGKTQAAEELLDAVLSTPSNGRPPNLGAFVARGTARALQRKLEGTTCLPAVHFVDSFLQNK